MMGIVERKQREKNARIQQIKHIAANLFQKKGFENTTMDQIADACELSKASIYLHFKSKDDLLFSITEPAIVELNKRTAAIANNKQEPADKTIIKMFMEACKAHQTNHDAFKIYIRGNYDGLHNDKIRRLENVIRSNYGIMEAVVQRGIDQGIFKEIDPKLTAIILWNLFMGVYHVQSQRVESGRSDYRKSTVHAAAELILSGLKKL